MNTFGLMSATSVIVAAAAGVPCVQAQHGTAAVGGAVIDARSRAPIPGVDLVLVSHGQLRINVDSAGRFLQRGLGAGLHRLEANAVGYAVGAWVVVLNEGQSVTTLELKLEPREYVLPAIEAAAVPPPQNRGLREFERRRVAGHGIFVTPEEIARRQPVTVGELLRTVPGVTTSCDRVTGCYLRMVRAPRGCRAEVFVDGISATLVMQAETPALDIVAVEVYRSISETPAEFTRLENTCGVIAIWTHAGPMERQ